MLDRATPRLSSSRSFVVKYRPLVPLAAAAVAVTVLAGCDTKVGAAATVGSSTIRESQVNRYLTAKAKPIATQGGSIVPRSYVLQDLIRQDLMLRGLARNGGVPGNKTVAQVETQLKQGRSDAEVEAGYVRYGFTRSMAALDFRVNALESLLANRTKARDLPTLAKVVNKMGVPVSVNSRYGAWTPTSLAVATSNGAGLPSVVSLQPTPQAQP
jgi:hypothetical protein